MKQKGSIIYVSYTSAKEKEEALRHIEKHIKHKRILDNGCVLEVVLNEIHRDFVDLNGLEDICREKARLQKASKEYYKRKIGRK